MTGPRPLRISAHQRLNGRHVVFSDDGLLSRFASASSVVLAAWSDAPLDMARRHLTASVTFTYFVEGGQRREVPGPAVRLMALPAPPPEIDVAADSVCFEIARPHELFGAHVDARRMEFDLDSDWPNLTMEFWVVGSPGPSPLPDRFGSSATADSSEAPNRSWPVRMPFEDRRYGIHVARIPGGVAAYATSMVLAVRSDQAPDTARRTLPAEVVIAPVHQVVHLTSHALRGIGMSALPEAPAQVIGAPGTVYFKLNRRSEFFQALRSSEALAVKFGGARSNLEMTLWALDEPAEVAPPPVWIPFEEYPFDRDATMHIAVFPDGVFPVRAAMLAVRCDLSPEEVLRSFPLEVMAGPIGPADLEPVSPHADLDSLHIRLSWLPVVPRELPFPPDTTCFVIDRSGEFFRTCVNAGGIQFLIGDEWPNLKMELWAISPPPGPVPELPIRIAFEPRRYGIHVGRIDPVGSKIMQVSSLVLVVRCGLPPATVRRTFAESVRIVPVERIAEIVNSALAGIELATLPEPPSELRVGDGTVCFRLDRSSELSKALFTSGGIAAHVDGDWPDLAMELWFLKEPELPVTARGKK